jgi:hypothetical protein
VEQCANRRCDRTATRWVDLRGRDGVTGEERVIREHVCDEHYTDLTTPCAADGCDRLGVNVIAVTGHAVDSEERRDDEMRVCDDCLTKLQGAAAVSINSVRMIHDGALHFHALPANPGRG